MSFIAFELDALNNVPHVAKAVGLQPQDISHGLLQTWAYCFREKTAKVSAVHLRGFFGADIAAALEAFGFIEADADLGYRVRGADRYLRISEGRSLGGKKAHAAGQLKQGGSKDRKPAGQKRKRTTTGEPQAATSSSPGYLGLTSSSNAGAEPQLSPRLSPTTDDRSIDLPTVDLQAPVALSRKRLVSDELVKIFQTERKSKYAFRGAVDGAALDRLLTFGADEEIFARWRKALRSTGWASASTIAQLASKWNDLTAGVAGEPPKGAARGAATDWSQIDPNIKKENIFDE